MDIQQQRIQDDLRGLLNGDVHCDDLTTQLYSSDASIYQMRPLGVIRPRSIADVVSVVQYANEHELSIHPRGAGSGTAGESLGRGLVVDFSQYLRRIDLVGDGSRVHVQSGSVLADVNRMLRPYGRAYGPDPVTRSVTTMGSVLATNATGSHFLRSGTARDTIESMRVVTIDGELLELSQHEIHPHEIYPVTESDQQDTPSRLARGVHEIHEQFLSNRRPPVSFPSRGGYRLDDIFDSSGHVDLAKFLVGTQGTLAIIVDAVVRTEAVASHRGVVLLFYHRLEMAARSAVSALDHGLVACDLMDRRLLRIARDTDSRFEQILPPNAEAMVLLEIQGESLSDLRDRINVIRQDLCSGHDAAFTSIETTDREERNLYWALSRRVIPRLSRFQRSEAPLPFIEELSVLPQRLPETLTAIQDLLKSEQTTATVFAHIGQGQLQLRPFLNLSRDEDRRRLLRLSQRTAEVVWQHGGHVGIQHVAGLSRTYLLPQQYGDYWQAMGQLKRLFDPHHRLNPGKLFGAVLQKPNENLRPADRNIAVTANGRTLVEADPSTAHHAIEGGHAVPELPVLQQWPANNLVTAVTRSCNGCGRCRTTALGERQCPVFRATQREEATPRAKANLLRGVLSGDLSLDELATDQCKEITDLCFNCHQCRLECPASVDIPKIVGELKAQYLATNGLPLSDALMGRIDTIVRVAASVPWLSNLLIRSPVARFFAERLFGLSAARELPEVVRETFLRHAVGRRWHQPSESGGLKVVYFVDQYANYHDPDIGKALAEILQQNSIGLFVPVNQHSSGMARITTGELRGARRIARRNVRLLAEAVRSGYTVLATEPSAVLCLKHEYPNLLDDEDAILVAEHSFEACEFLLKLHQGNRLSLDFQRVDATVAYHQPCHLRVLDPIGCGPTLLEMIPGMNVQRIEEGCTGMAGTWGLQKKNYRNSLRIGWPLISAMRTAKVTSATTECSACRMQIEHGSDQKTIHPLKLLAYAYGRLPKIEKELLGEPSR